MSIDLQFLIKGSNLICRQKTNFNIGIKDAKGIISRTSRACGYLPRRLRWKYFVFNMRCKMLMPCLFMKEGKNVVTLHMPFKICPVNKSNLDFCSVTVHQVLFDVRALNAESLRFTQLMIIEKRTTLIFHQLIKGLQRLLPFQDQSLCVEFLWDLSFLV